MLEVSQPVHPVLEKMGPEMGQGRDLPWITLGQAELAPEPGDPIPSYARLHSGTWFSRMLLGKEADSSESLCTYSADKL